jgi:hypothetical protein
MHIPDEDITDIKKCTVAAVAAVIDKLNVY